MNDLLQPLTPAERAFWRRLCRQHEKYQRIAKRALSNMLTRKQTSHHLFRKEVVNA